MDVTDITAQLNQLDGDIDKMEETMKSLIANLPEIAAKLPLLDKAKLYVLAVYTIETTLFSQFLYFSPPGPKVADTCSRCSSPTGYRRKDTPHFYRTHPRQAVLCQDQDSRGASRRA